MVNRRTPRPLLGAKPRRVGRPDMRDYSNSRSNNPGKTPSREYDWDTALYKNALTMRACGYTLSAEQQKRIDDHA